MIEDWDEDVWLARRMVLDAGAQAARLRHQASAQAATIRAAAEREAGLIWRQTSVQAAELREATEREAAQLRATVIKLSAAPAAQALVASGPASQEASQESSQQARPVRRPPGRPRQLMAARTAAAATAALFLFAVAAGSAEVALHGFAFFVFRSAGTGETNHNGLQEDQGPGQPAAPRPAASHRPHGDHRG